MLMKRIGLPLFAAVLITAAHSAIGQLFTADSPAKSPADSIAQTQRVPSSADKTQQNPRPPITWQTPTPTAGNNPIRNEGSKLTFASAPASESAREDNVVFASPAATGEQSDTPFHSTNAVALPPAPGPGSTPFPNGGVPVNSGGPAPLPAQAARPVAQNAVTKTHWLRLSPPVFEKNLVEKLRSRFVPVQNAAGAAGISQYNLPAKDGTGVELVINQQQGIVSITGSPKMVESCLQIVQFLDTEEVTGGPVTKFVPVQQSNINSARRVADIVNQQTMQAAQAVPANPAMPPFLPPEDALALDGDAVSGRVVGPVNIDIIDAFGTMVIKGPPQDVAAIRAMIQQLEALSVENEPVIELIPMRHADSLRISQLVQQLYQTIYANRRGVITMLPLVKPNTILVIGKQESIDAAKELIAKLDTPVNPHANFRIFYLKHAGATELAAQINSSYTGRATNNQNQMLAPQINVIADVRTNTLIVQASPRDLDEVAAMIRRLDVPGSQITTTTKQFPLKYTTAANLATVVQQALLGSYSGALGSRGTQLEIGGAEGNPARASVLYNVSIVPDTPNNRLVVTAPVETMPLIAALIEQLDQPPAAETKLKVFNLTNGDASSLTAMLTSLFAAGAANQLTAVRPGLEPGDSPLVGIRFIAEIRSNSIVALGSAGELALAEALLLRLDSENQNNRRIFIKKMTNVPAEEIATLLSNYASGEQALEIQNLTTFTPHSPLEQYQKEVIVYAEPISNSLIVSTTPRFYEQIRKIVDELDERPLMVAIDVLIAEVTLNNSRDQGVEIGLQDSILFSQPLPTLPGFLQMPGKAIGTQGITTLGVGQGNGFSFSASSESVNMYIRALETRNKTQVLSRPRLITIHNRRAQLNVGQVIPYAGDVTYSTQGNPIIGQNQQDVGTQLDITPRIMPDGMVSMAVLVVRNSVAAWHDIVPGVRSPELNNASTSTTINAMDGQTVIFSGLISEEKTSNNTSVPVLNKIPVVKHFFENDSKITRRSELLITLTPRIIRTQADLGRLNKQEEERMHWCVSDVVKLTGDGSIRRRSDEWYPNEVPYSPGTSGRLNDSQLPAENKIPSPVLLAPEVL